MSVRQKIKNRAETLSKAEKAEKIIILVRDLAFYKPPKLALSFAIETLNLWTTNSAEEQLMTQEAETLKAEILRIQKMYPEEFYEELKTVL